MVVFRAGCYAVLLQQRAIIMTPFVCNALQGALNWNLKRTRRIEPFEAISHAKVPYLMDSSHCGAYTHMFSCMYFHVPSSHRLSGLYSASYHL